MTRHLLKLVWNRKRTNALIILEIFFSFLVVFVVGTLGLWLLDNYRRPLGFSYDNVWNVAIDMRQTGDDTFTADQVATFKRILDEVQTLAPVEAAAGSMALPYSLASYNSSRDFDGRQIGYQVSEVTRDLDKVLRLDVSAGRWFEEADEALAWQPVVINARLAREVFGDEDPVGKTFIDDLRVVGVVSEFRRNGELAPPGNFLFHLKRVGHPEHRPAPNLLVRVQPGTSAAFEEVLVKRLQGVARGWSFEIKPLMEMRRTSFRTFLTPLAAAGIVSLFLLLMVGLGLIGVLWQNLLQRTREIGLRRATGASRRSVHSQVITEQLILTTLGVLAGALLVAQIPVLDLIGFINDRIFIGGLVFAMASIYLLSLLCALYPSALAARVQPAEALRYE